MNDYILVNHLPVILEKKKVSTILNAEINRRFSEDNPLEIDIDDSKSVNLFTNGDVEFDFRDSTIYVVVPMQIAAQIGLPVGEVSVDAQIKVHTQSELDIQSDFAINTTSKVSQVEWISGPDIQPKLVDALIPDSLIKNAVEKRVPELGEKIDEAIMKVLVMDTLLGKMAWERIIPIELPRGQAIYLKIKPDFLELEEIKDDEKTLKIAANCKWFFETTTKGDVADEKYIPKVQYLESDQHEITRIYVKVELANLSDPLLTFIKSTDKIESAIKSKIEKIIIRQIKDDAVAVAMKLSGALNGGLSVVGIPVYNRESMMLDFENMSFDFTGKNILSGIAGNLALTVAKSFIKKQFPINLEPIFENLITTVNETLKEINFNQDMGIKGEITEFDVENFMIADGKLELTLAADFGLNFI